jgi:hypothetical protein
MAFSAAVSPFRTPLRTNYWMIDLYSGLPVGLGQFLHWHFRYEQLVPGKHTVFFFLGFFNHYLQEVSFSDLSYLLICVYLCPPCISDQNILMLKIP